ncbi:MAG: arginase family protein [Acidobacteria bacterium]|nr:arginase family protein [Acidobacteriota bacterium]
MNFGGIEDARYSSFETARVVVFPYSPENPETGAAEILAASRRLPLYDEETDAETYKIGIHTLERPFPANASESPEENFYLIAEELLRAGKFICLLGGDDAFTVSVARAYVERFHNLSVLRIGARAVFDEPETAAPSLLVRLVREWQLPAVQVGLRAVSAETIRALADFPRSFKFFRASDIAGETGRIDEALEQLTERVWLTIDCDGLDPSIMPAVPRPEPGGLGWFDIVGLIRGLTRKRRVVGMSLAGFSTERLGAAPAYLCAKLIYQTLGFVFRDEAPKVVGGP